MSDTVEIRDYKTNADGSPLGSYLGGRYSNTVLPAASEEGGVPGFDPMRPADTVVIWDSKDGSHFDRYVIQTSQMNRDAMNQAVSQANVSQRNLTREERQERSLQAILQAGASSGAISQGPSNVNQPYQQPQQPMVQQTMRSEIDEAVRAAGFQPQMPPQYQPMPPQYQPPQFQYPTQPQPQPNPQHQYPPQPSMVQPTGWEPPPARPQQPPAPQFPPNQVMPNMLPQPGKSLFATNQPQTLQPVPQSGAPTGPPTKMVTFESDQTKFQTTAYFHDVLIDLERRFLVLVFNNQALGYPKMFPMGHEDDRIAVEYQGQVVVIRSPRAKFTLYNMEICLADIEQVLSPQ